MSQLRQALRASVVLPDTAPPWCVPLGSAYWFAEMSDERFDALEHARMLAPDNPITFRCQVTGSNAFAGFVMATELI